jgi:hypothetical protein
MLVQLILTNNAICRKTSSSDHCRSIKSLFSTYINYRGKAAITRQVSTAAWQIINLSGTYQFASNRKLSDLQELTRPITEN